jgi:uncharacterized protein YidB (DUF937 family)
MEDTMGLLDDMEDKVFHSVAASNPTAAALLQMINNHPGGISGLLQAFHEQGLGGIASSWVGTGANQAVSPQQIQSVLQNEHIQAFAAKAGISPDQATSMIAQFLPMVIDKLTPNGQVPPQTNLLEMGMNMLQSFGKTGTTA